MASFVGDGEAVEGAIRSRSVSVTSTGSVRDGNLGAKPSREDAVRAVITVRCR